MSPDNVRLDRVSDRLVRVSWNAANDDSKCQTYFFITGTQNGQSINERVPGSERSYDIPGQAQGTWNVEVGMNAPDDLNEFCLQVRAVNSAGSGPSSPIVYLSSAKQCRSTHTHAHIPTTVNVQTSHSNTTNFYVNCATLSKSLSSISIILSSPLFLSVILNFYRILLSL